MLRRLSVVALLLTAACAPEYEYEGTAARVASPIIKGTDSPDEQDAVVLLMHYDAIQIGGAAAGCTGTLLAPRLVLTARHCVAVTDESAACDANGNPTFGGEIQGDHMATKLYAFSGRKRPDFLLGLEKGARGAEILDDASKTLCNHDIALVLLDRPLAGGKTAPVRLDDGPRMGESVLVVGWGVTDKSSNPPTRQQRGGVKVLTVGPAEALGPAEFSLGESGCAGDSGGPAFAEETGAVLGVLSRGGNGGAAMPGDAQGCLNAENVFTSAAKYKDLLLSAYAKAGQEPWLEGQPDPATLPPKQPPEPAAAAEESSGCGIAPESHRGGLSFGFALALAALTACFARRATRS